MLSYNHSVKFYTRLDNVSYSGSMGIVRFPKMGWVCVNSENSILLYNSLMKWEKASCSSRFEPPEICLCDKTVNWKKFSLQSDRCYYMASSSHRLIWNQLTVEMMEKKNPCRFLNVSLICLLSQAMNEGVERLLYEDVGLGWQPVGFFSCLDNNLVCWRNFYWYSLMVNYTKV